MNPRVFAKSLKDLKTHQKSSPKGHCLLMPFLHSSMWSSQRVGGPWSCSSSCHSQTKLHYCPRVVCITKLYHLQPQNWAFFWRLKGRKCVEIPGMWLLCFLPSESCESDTASAESLSSSPASGPCLVPPLSVLFCCSVLQPDFPPEPGEIHVGGLKHSTVPVPELWSTASPPGSSALS